MKKLFVCLGAVLAFTALPASLNASRITETALEIQQNKITVAGVVVDTNGEPIIAANVFVEGTTSGTATDIDGKFTIECAPGAVLDFSCIGYMDQKITVSSATSSLRIVLENDSEMLDELVVVGYGQMKKSDVTGSLASIDASEMMKKNPLNLGQGLQGAAAGVSVIRTSGDPSGSFSIRIRGVATVNGSADPLYVVDGVQVGTSIDFLNPNDIESIEILKDASATAIYGSRGANGVIMITTKSGSKGKAVVNFSANFSVQSNSNHIEVADAELFASAVRQAVATDGTALTNLAYSEAYIGKLNNIDWQDEMSRTAIQQNYNLSASGGSENTQADISIGYLDNQGVVIESYYKRLTGRANVTHKVKDFLQVGTSLNFTHTEGHGSGNLMSYARAIPTMDYVEGGTFYSMPIVLSDGSWGHYKMEGNGDVPKSADNRVAAAKENQSISKGNRVLLSGFVNIDILKGLSFKTIGSYNYYSHHYDGYSPVNKRTYSSQDNPDSFSISQSQSNSLGLESFLTYQLTSEKHRLTAMAGFSMSDTDGAWLNTSAKDFPADNIRIISLTNDPSTMETDGGINLKSRFVSYFGRVNYAFKDRYIVTATVRRDGSSNFGAGNRWGTFPSAALAWRLSEENFIKNLNVFSNLKLRLGWGQTGNAGNATSLSVPQLSSSGTMYYVKKDGSVASAPGIAQKNEIDTNLKWETNEQTNVGLDFGIKGTGLNISVDYFLRDAKDLLLYRQIRPSTGFEQVYTNAGHIRNSGFEFVVSWDKSFGDWTFGAKFNASTLKNKAIEVGDPIYTTSTEDGDKWTNHSITMNGYPVGSYYGWKTDGIYRSQSEIDAMNAYAVSKGVESGYYQGQTVQPGDYKYVDVNGDGEITDEDRTVIGNGYPKFNYGLNLNASWKNIDFSMNLYGVAGMNILSYASARLTTIHNSSDGYQNLLADYVRNAWSSTNTESNYPRITKTDYNYNIRVSDAFIKKGDYLKISNVQIGYTFPKQILKRTKIDNARVYVNVDNLYTFSSYKCYGDPEVGSSNVLLSGFDGGRYPFPMAVSFGLNVSF